MLPEGDATTNFFVVKNNSRKSKFFIIYLRGDSFLTNGEKQGSLTFCWENKRAGLQGQLFFTSRL